MDKFRFIVLKPVVHGVHPTAIDENLLFFLLCLIKL